MIAGRLSALAMVPHEPDQASRLEDFRAEYPDVRVYAGPGFRQAEIPAGVIPSETTVQIITRPDLRGLLDELYARLKGVPDDQGRGAG